MAHTTPFTESTGILDKAPTESWLTKQLAFLLNSLDSRLKGKLFTMVDALGMSDRQTKSLKDIINQIVESELSFAGRDTEWFLDEIRRLGIQRDDSQSKEERIAGGLEHYRHWRSRIEEPAAISN